MADSKKRTQDVFDLDRIRSLIDLMKEHGLSELDLRQEDQQVRLCRGGPVAAAAPPPAPAAAPAPAPAPAAGQAEPEANVEYITSPMVGTFYSRPNPNSESFVKIGDHVDKETTVCIVEAMKVFNEIPAEINGRIVAVLVDDEEAVDYGKPLFKVDTSK